MKTRDGQMDSEVYINSQISYSRTLNVLLTGPFSFAIPLLLVHSTRVAFQRPAMLRKTNIEKRVEISKNMNTE